MCSGDWAELYVRAERQAGRQRQWPQQQLSDLWRGEGLTVGWWLALTVVPAVRDPHNMDYPPTRWP